MKCFNGTHIPIGIVAILVLMCCVALPPFTVLVSLNKLKRPSWIRFLEEPLTYAYKDNYKWWSGIELGKRIVLVVFAITLPNNDYAVIFTLMIVITVCGYCQPYKSLLVNVLDLLLACDILIMLMLRNTTYLQEQYQVFEDYEEDSQRSLNSELCIERFTTITNMTLVLTLFYYLPLAVSGAVFACWVGYRVYSQLVKVKRTPKPKRNSFKFKKQISTREAKPRTQTIVDINDLDPQSPLAEQSKTAFELLSIDNIKHTTPEDATIVYYSQTSV